MDMTTARKKLNIPGYVHPKSNNSRNSMYKTFSEGGKKKKDMTKFKTTELNDGYSMVNIEISESHICPIKDCGQTCVFICQCAYNDKRCSNGHIWYINREGEKKIGNPHK